MYDHTDLNSMVERGGMEEARERVREREREREGEVGGFWMFNDTWFQ